VLTAASHSTVAVTYDRSTFDTGRLVIRDGDLELMTGLAQGELSFSA
jgi:hypothetical protein